MWCARRELRLDDGAVQERRRQTAIRRCGVNAVPRTDRFRGLDEVQTTGLAAVSFEDSFRTEFETRSCRTRQAGEPAVVRIGDR